MEKSNQTLMGCNNIAERQQQSLLSQLRHHTVLLQEMKKDLHSVFIRIRRLKAVLQERNPEVWSVIDSDEKAAGRSTEPASSWLRFDATWQYKRTMFKKAVNISFLMIFHLIIAAFCSFVTTRLVIVVFTKIFSTRFSFDTDHAYIDAGSEL